MTADESDDCTEIKSPPGLFHLARLLEDGINPLTETVTGGVVDLSGEPFSEEVRYTGIIFNGPLTSNQIIKIPNITRWWWVQNATSGPFTLKMQTPFGQVSSAIPRSSQWQRIHCDGNNNIVVSAQRNRSKEVGAREWFGVEREQALTKVFDLSLVPVNKRGFEIRSEVNDAVESALLVHLIRKVKRRKDMRLRLRNIAKLGGELLNALDDLDDEVFRACRVDRVSIVRLFATLLDVPFRHFARSKPKQGSHRPRGSTQNPVLRMLIRQLYYSIVEGGQGKLTLYRNAGDIKGTLPAVLEILRPYLPEVIPIKLSYKTLREILKSSRHSSTRLALGPKTP
jgi:hypothetical protein